jgi:hypothetical protein
MRERSIPYLSLCAGTSRRRSGSTPTAAPLLVLNERTSLFRISRRSSARAFSSCRFSATRFAGYRSWAQAPFVDSEMHVFRP